LSKEVQQELQKIYHQHACFRNRQRAHAILLSQRGYSLNQIRDILQADRDSISVWIDNSRTGCLGSLRRGFALLTRLQSRTELNRNSVAFCEISLVAFVQLFEL
jgi:hypothetical protein